jgi:hypothetical protein
MTLRGIARKSFGGIVAVALTSGVYTFGQTRSVPADPGLRGGPAGAGTPLKGLTADETAFFQDGQARFAMILAKCLATAMHVKFHGGPVVEWPGAIAGTQPSKNRT